MLPVSPIGRYIETDSVVHSLDARTKSACVLLAIAACLSIGSAWSLAMVVAFFLLAVASARTRLSVAIGSVRLALFLVGLAALLNFLFSPLSVMMPFYVEDHLFTSPGVRATPDWLGFLLAALGAGALIGFALAGALRMSGRGRAITSIGALFLVCTALGAAGLTDRALVALALFVVIGAGSGIVNIGIATTLQLTTPSEIRGRVFGLLGTLSGGLMPIGMGLAGVIVDIAGRDIPLILRVCGGAAALVMVPIALDRSFRSFLASEIPSDAVGATGAPTAPRTPPM